MEHGTWNVNSYFEVKILAGALSSQPLLFCKKRNGKDKVVISSIYQLLYTTVFFIPFL
jgi:hypothetical protein